MEPFAVVFMSVSMLAVTCLAGWCITKILRSGPGDKDQTD